MAAAVQAGTDEGMGIDTGCTKTMTLGVFDEHFFAFGKIAQGRVHLIAEDPEMTMGQSLVFFVFENQFTLHR